MAFKTSHISTSRLRPPGLGSPNHVTQKFILCTGQVAGVCFTHVPLSVLSMIYTSAYTERAFLQTDRLFKHPLTQSKICITKLLPGKEPKSNIEMMLVAGSSGIGKTAVVNEVHKPIVRQRGYFIKGKFDQFQRNIPFFAFVQAFRYLIGQLLSETDAQLKQWKSKILTALGENAQVIIEVIPELERIIGKQPPVSELSGTALQNPG